MQKKTYSIVWRRVSKTAELELGMVKEMVK